MFFVSFTGRWQCSVTERTTIGTLRVGGGRVLPGWGRCTMKSPSPPPWRQTPPPPHCIAFPSPGRLQQMPGTRLEVLARGSKEFVSQDREHVEKLQRRPQFIQVVSASIATLARGKTASLVFVPTWQRPVDQTHWRDGPNGRIDGL